jgi:hypothetical protein
METTHMKVNIFRRIVKGRGTMRSMKSVISATSSRNTCGENVSAELRVRCRAAGTGLQQHHRKGCGQC